jgi:hypothetical protein
MRIRPSAPAHITSHNRVTEIQKVIRIMRLIHNKKLKSYIHIINELAKSKPDKSVQDLVSKLYLHKKIITHFSQYLTFHC